MKRIGITIIAILFFTLASGPAVAGLFLELVVETKGITGKKDSAWTIKNHITEYASRTDKNSEINILDCETMTMYRLDTQKKVYEKSRFAPPPKQEKKIKQMFGEIVVTPTKEMRKIQGHDCVKHIVSFMMTSTDYWGAKDVKEHAELSEIGKKNKKCQKIIPITTQH